MDKVARYCGNHDEPCMLPCAGCAADCDVTDILPADHSPEA